MLVFESEARDVGGLFTNNFGFYIRYYQIPLNDSQLEFGRRIVELLDAHQKQETLLIIHPRGHSNEHYDDAGERRSVWCAYVRRKLLTLFNERLMAVC